MQESKSRKLLFIPDNDTDVDLLYYQPIADALTELVEDAGKQPISIGVHGDWGAGKSSVLSMVEKRLKAVPGTHCIRFDGWRFQGFDDAKTVMLEMIVDDLRKSQTYGTKIKKKASGLIKRIRWMKVGKSALRVVGDLGGVHLTGMPLGTMLASTVAKGKDLLQDPKSATDLLDKDQIAEDAKDLLSEAEDETETSVAGNIHAFNKEFEELLAEAGIVKLIVLVDDLDRCLPETTIDTMEAIRLFLFVPRTAFILAADEGMIEYAVRKHFPDLPTSASPTSYARNYLEKLIQVPFRLPALGIEEAKVYVLLLMVQALVGDKHEGFSTLVGKAREVIRQPWLTNTITLDDVVAVEPSSRDALGAAYAFSVQIAGTVAEGTSGNPRQIKRFLNTLAVREAIARARGLESLIKRDKLAKIMLVERFRPDVYTRIGEIATASNGKVDDLALLESIARGEKGVEAAGTKSALAAWLEDGWMKEWGRVEPRLGPEDLRPYLFIARDRKSTTFRASGSEQVADMVKLLAQGRLAIASATDRIKALSPADQDSVFNELSDALLQNENLKAPPPEFPGICKLVEVHPRLEGRFLETVDTLPIDVAGPWAAGGWNPEKWSPGQNRAKAKSIIEGWATEGNKPLKRVAEPLLKKLL